MINHICICRALFLSNSHTYICVPESKNGLRPMLTLVHEDRFYSQSNISETVLLILIIIIIIISTAYCFREIIIIIAPFGRHSLYAEHRANGAGARRVYEFVFSTFSDNATPIKQCVLWSLFRSEKFLIKF